MMASKRDQDWQTTKNTVLERNCHMFNNPLMSDITFTSGESKRKYLYAHKYVLATSSPVFYAMFYGDLAEKNSVIHLRDTDEESLEEFLRFLYTDQCTEAPEIAVKVLYLAKKYMIPSLTQKCIEVVKSNIKTENVVTVLEQAMRFDEKGLEEKCWKVVDLQTRKAVTSDAFNDISRLTLISLLERNTLKIAEVELFQAVLKWSDRQCSKTGLESTGENRRSVVGDAVYQIRFLSMSQKEFAQYVSSSGLLTAEEMIPIYEKLNGFDSPNLKWKLPRRQAKSLKFARFSKSNVKPPGNWWTYVSGKPDILSFSVNESVRFHGVYLFGDDKRGNYEVTLAVNGERVSRTYTSALSNEGIYGFEVMLPTPIFVDKNAVVKIVATIKGPNSCYGQNGKASVEVDGVTMTTYGEPLELGANGTSVSRGQFYQILLSKR